jgi:hypothetical protein
MIRQEIKPSDQQGTVLDYSHADDQLVGIICAFRERAPDEDARLLTHDTGPMASARAVGVTIAAVPDDWLLPSEPSTAEKQVATLTAEVERLKNVGPKIEIICIDLNDGRQINRIDAKLTRFRPLPTDELRALLGRLQERFPLATDFGSRERIERKAQGASFAPYNYLERFEPATERQISDYNEDYRKWLSECENALKALHWTLIHDKDQVQFVFSAKNKGTRPADGTLVTLSSEGNFKIFPIPKKESSEKKGKDRASNSSLPSPPRAPKGNWRSVSAFEILSGNIGESTALDVGALQRAMGRDYSVPFLPERLTRDPNAFYFVDGPPCIARSEYSLECAQWRHGLEEQRFSVEVRIPMNETRISGLVNCRIYAQNMSDTVEVEVPIRIDISLLDIVQAAKAIVEAVTSRP